MVLARVIELTSKAQVPRVLSDLGPEVSSLGFCGGWFIWLWLFLALAVGCPGGFVLGRGTHPDGGVWPGDARPVDPLGGGDHWRRRCPPKEPWPKDELGLVQRAQRLGQGKAERRPPLEPTETSASASARAAP